MATDMRNASARNTQVERESNNALWVVLAIIVLVGVAYAAYASYHDQGYTTRAAATNADTSAVTTPNTATGANQ